MYQEIKSVLSKIGIELHNEDKKSLILVELILNYKIRLLKMNKKAKNKLKKKIILIVSESEYVSNLLKELLIDLFEVKRVFEVGKALDKVLEYKPFVLILDNELPNINSVNFSLEVKKHFHNEIKIIMRSSKDIKTFKKEKKLDKLKMDEIIDAYVQKPESLEILFEIILNWALDSFYL